MENEADKNSKEYLGRKSLQCTQNPQSSKCLLSQCLSKTDLAMIQLKTRFTTKYG